jgi:CubicO group peptidase (beta-lactamase class C family)
MTRRFKQCIPSIAAIMFALILCAPTAYSRDCSGIEGQWKGNININETKLEIVVDFSQTEEGDYTGEIDIPLQGAKDLPLDSIRLAEPKVHFTMPDVPGNPMFEGNLSANADTISGDFFQGGQKFDFILIRLDEEEAARKEIALQENLAKIENFCDSMYSIWEPPGFAVGVVYDGKLVFAHGFGYRNIDDSLPATPTTLYAIGSTTKAFTTAAMAMLADEGLLDWDKKVVNYLPDFRLKDDYATMHMTPVDMVTHRSGLPRHDLLWYNSPLTREELFYRLRYLQPSAELRAEFQYNNLMFMTAGLLIEHLSGLTWEDFVQDRIFDPLEMVHSNLSVSESVLTDDYALPYRKEEDSLMEIPFRHLDAIGPAGSINSCIEDMANWLILNLDNGEFKGNRLVSEQEMEHIHSPQIVSAPDSQYPENSYPSYAMGWIVQYYRGHRHVWHNGGIDGFYTQVNTYPDDKLGIVAFVNQVDNRVIDVVSYYIADLFLGLESIDWNTRYRGPGADEEQQAEEEEQAEEEPVKGTKPSHPLKDYAGEYENDGYGTFKIWLDDKKLYGSYNNLETPMEHWHYDVFRCTEYIWEGAKINFLTNNKGDIEQISIVMEPKVDPIVFTKKPDAYLYDPEFLALLVGKYDLDGTTCMVDLQGENTLFVTVPGQPPYEMEPYKGTEFNLKDLNGFSVEFDMDKNMSTVYGLKFIQPNGIFEAKRIKSE